MFCVIYSSVQIRLIKGTQFFSGCHTKAWIFCMEVCILVVLTFSQNEEFDMMLSQAFLFYYGGWLPFHQFCQ